MFSYSGCFEHRALFADMSCSFADVSGFFADVQGSTVDTPQKRPVYNQKCVLHAKHAVAGCTTCCYILNVFYVWVFLQIMQALLLLCQALLRMYKTLSQIHRKRDLLSSKGVLRAKRAVAGCATCSQHSHYCLCLDDIIADRNEPLKDGTITHSQKNNSRLLSKNKSSNKSEYH